MPDSDAIHALTMDTIAPSIWGRLSTARGNRAFCEAWLAVLCAQLPHVQAGILLLGPDADGSFSPAATWPDAGKDMRHLVETAQKTLAERRGVVAAGAGGGAPVVHEAAHIGYPIEIADQLHGAVIVEVVPTALAELQHAARLVHWASAWVRERLQQQAVEQRDTRLGHLKNGMAMVATALQAQHFGAATLAVANEMAALLECDRVSIGFEVGGAIELVALSNTAVFDKRMQLVQVIAAAMEDVLDHGRGMAFPAAEGADDASLAHAAMARELSLVAVASVPLMEHHDIIGVVTLERSLGAPLSAANLELARTIGDLVAPILRLKRDGERSLWQTVRQQAAEAVGKLFGKGHGGVKLLTAASVLLVLALAVATGTYSVTAKAVVEGAIQRAAVAPFDGHIAESFVRAGDIVRAGQPLARLDDQNLKLQKRQLESMRDQASGRQRQALAAEDRGALMVTAAQIAQSDAQIALVAEKITRSALVAPFDGVIVSGDLSQLLGTPVEQGKVLFQVAPLDSYRVILEVDERDIAHLRLGETGDLVLSGLSDRRLGFVVKQITPVASQQEGRNFFRVEALLDDGAAGPRPGMEGVGKVRIGERKLLWIWTHSFVDWARSWVWKQLP